MATASSPVITRIQFTLNPSVSVPITINSIVATITKPLPPGYISGYWGTHFDASHTVELWTLWTSVSTAKDFLSSTKHTSLGYHLTPLLAPDTRIQSQIISFPSLTVLSSILHSPATEIQTFLGPQNVHFPEKAPEIKGLVGQLAGKVDGKVEILVGKGKEKELEKKRAVTVAIGWDDSGSKTERKERDMRDGYRFMFFDDEEENGIERERTWVKFQKF